MLRCSAAGLTSTRGGTILTQYLPARIPTVNRYPPMQATLQDPTALGLVPFQVNPHYYTGMNWVKHGDEFVEHFSETRDDRLREFHEMNDTPVIGLWEAGLLRCENGKVELIGTPARVFRKGQPPVDVQPGTALSEP